MVQIVTVDPERFRPSQRITINGVNFSPTFGQNAVTIDTILASIVSESETQLVIDVPVGVSQDQFVAVQVQRADSFENDATSRFCMGPIADLRDGTLRVPGQAPGAVEASALLVEIQDTFQAKDYMRLVTQAEYILREVLTTAGDLFASDGVLPPQRFAVGAAGLFLTADPGQPLGLIYAAGPARRNTHSWGKRIDAGAGNNGAMVANGDSDNPSVVDGEHAAGQAGTIDTVTVLVQSFVAGDTLDQVQIALNGGVVFDSGAGLGLTTFFNANPAIVVVATDRIEVRAFKAGANGVMRLRAKVGLD